MSEPDVQVMFVRVGKDGTVQKTHRFEPWDPQQALPGTVPGNEERPAVRHVTYEDPPGTGLSSDEYREMLRATVQQCGSLERFVETLAMILVNDNVQAHGVHMHDAVPAVMEFALKVYAEFTGTV